MDGLSMFKTKTPGVKNTFPSTTPATPATLVQPALAMALRRSRALLQLATSLLQGSACHV